MINELSQYNMSTFFQQKWIKKDWILTTMEHMKTKEIHNYVIDSNN
jgi:hypothetical protein